MKGDTNVRFAVFCIENANLFLPCFKQLSTVFFNRWFVWLRKTFKTSGSGLL